MTLLATELSDPTNSFTLESEPWRVSAAKRKCSPSGRNRGQHWRFPTAAAEATGAALPPAEETLYTVLQLGENKITPLGPHEPPKETGASASVIGGPPRVSIFFSFSSAKNPSQRLSGDQNG